MMNDYDITEAMLAYGGSFVQGLARLFRSADYINQEKLKHTFAYEWRKYAEMAAMKKEQAK